MEQKTFSEAVAVLSGEHGLSILQHLASGEWRIASDVSRTLAIHTTTASKFLTRMHELGFLERRLRKSHTRSAYEYRLPAKRIVLELEFENGQEPLREALDYYLDYVSKVLAKARRLGWPGVEERMESRLQTNRGGLKEHLFTRILDGGGARGMEDLKVLFGEISREFFEITSGAIGPATARRILAGAAEEAMQGRQAVVQRYGLRAVLES